MGRGDIKTKKGKIFAGSFGKKRPAKSSTSSAAPVAKVEKVETPVKKTRAKKAE